MLLLDPYFYLNLTSAIFILVSTGIPIYLSIQLNGKIKQLTLLLAAFILVHSSYHIAIVLGYEFIGTGILDPLSVVVLISFGLFYFRLVQSHARKGR